MCLFVVATANKCVRVFFSLFFFFFEVCSCFGVTC